MSANHVRSPHLFGLRFLGESPGKGFSEGFFEESRSEVGFLYGRAVNWNWGLASLSTGIAVAWEETASGSVTWTTAGVPLQATLYLTVPHRPVDWIGLKVGGHAHVNFVLGTADRRSGLLVLLTYQRHEAEGVKFLPLVIVRPRAGAGDARHGLAATPPNGNDEPTARTTARF